MESCEDYPNFLKSSKVQVENYRPIANLCSTSKVFEKLTLKQIQYLENMNKLDLTGNNNMALREKRVLPLQGPFYNHLLLELQMKIVML